MRMRRSLKPLPASSPCHETTHASIPAARAMTACAFTSGGASVE